MRLSHEPHPLRAGRRLWIATAAALAVGLLAGLGAVMAREATKSYVDGTSTSQGITSGLAGYAYGEGLHQRKCSNREVKIIRKRHGADRLIKSVHSDPDMDGYWSHYFANGLKKGRYYFRIDRKDINRVDYCRKAESDPQLFHFPDPNP